MLKVYLHFAAPDKVSPKNLLGRLDIGYAKLDARADYKLVMTAAGEGEVPPATLAAYPRWSANVWDLVTRAICMCLHRREELPGDFGQGRGAFIQDLTAVIEHWPDGVDTRKSTVGTAHVQMRRRRCHYTATFQDDILGESRSSVFVHAPEGLMPWDLLARAYAWSVHEKFDLPPRPRLYTPIPVQEGAESYVALNTVSEPAATGISRWLQKLGRKTASVEFLNGPCVPEAWFVEFLRRAV